MDIHNDNGSNDNTTNKPHTREKEKMKQGGRSWKSSHKSKAGMKTRTKCQYCGRQYKQEHTKSAHENSCKTYNEARK